MRVSVEGISYRIQDKNLLRSISLEVNKGELVGLIGPNGSGKSTLLKNIYRVLQPASGRISLDERELSQLSHKETAQQMAVVGQEAAVAFSFTVRDIVMMGRNPHKRWFDMDSQADQQIVEESLDRVGMLDDIDRNFSTLSGGEKQRVLIARALTQQAQFLVLDEPTNHLDIMHQLQMMDLVKALKLTAIAALHDLNIAALYCDRLVVLKKGQVVASGLTEEILTAELLLDVFGVAAEIVNHPLTGKPSITYLPRLATMNQR